MGPPARERIRVDAPGGHRIKLPKIGEKFRELDDGTRQRLPVLAAMLLVLSLSVEAFLNNGLHGPVDQLLGGLTVYLGADAVIALVLLLAVLAGVLSDKGLRWSVAVAWALYLPSVLYFSQIDWLYILGLGSNLSLLRSNLPDAYIVLNGAALVGTSVLLRSYLEVRRLRQDLLDRGGLLPEVDAACAKNMLFLTRTVAVSAASTVAIWGVVVLGSSLGGGSGAVGSAYLWTALAGLALLLVLFLVMMGRNVRSGKEKAAP